MHIGRRIIQSSMVCRELKGEVRAELLGRPTALAAVTECLRLDGWVRSSSARERGAHEVREARISCSTVRFAFTLYMPEKGRVVGSTRNVVGMSGMISTKVFNWST